MRWLAALLLLGLPVLGSALEVRPNPAKVDTAITRGLGFLAKDAVVWKNERKCVTCHHTALVILAMHEAKLRGHAVDGRVPFVTPSERRLVLQENEGD